MEVVDILLFFSKYWKVNFDILQFGKNFDLKVKNKPFLILNILLSKEKTFAVGTIN